MAELRAKTACDGLLPLSVGALHLAEADPGPLTLLAPLPGQEPELAGALKAAHGLRVPEPGRFESAGAAQLIWFGRAQWLLAGVRADPQVRQVCTATDQSDGWAVVDLSGPRVRDVLARRVPVDLRHGCFGPGQTARTELQHMPVSLSCLSDTQFRIMAFRSMAATLVHDLSTAMRSI